MPLRVVLAAAILALGAGPAAATSFEILINPIQVCKDDGTGCAQIGFFEEETDKIWAQADIDIVFGSTTQLNQGELLNINYNEQDHIDLYQAANALVGDPETTLIVNMIFVDQLGPTDAGGVFGLGCGAAVFSAFCGGETGVIIADEVFAFNGGIGRLDTLAHEIGHVVGLTHGGTTDDENFMRDGSSRSVPSTIDDIAPDGLGLDKMAQDQIDRVFSAPNNRFVHPVPEPGAVGQFALGALLVASRLRRRQA